MYDEVTTDIPSDEFEVKPRDYYSGGSRKSCSVCGSRMTDFMTTNGPESVYLHNECYKNMKLVLAVILEENSTTLTSVLI